MMAGRVRMGGRAAFAGVLLLGGGGAAVVDAGDQPAIIVMTPPLCGHQVLPPKTQLQGGKDSIRWTIVDACASSQKVLLCTYEANAFANPFETCDPASRDIGKPFPVKKGETVHVSCRAKELPQGVNTASYVKVVHTGVTVPAACPSTLGSHAEGTHAEPKSGKVGILTHRLDVEIVK